MFTNRKIRTAVGAILTGLAVAGAGTLTLGATGCSGSGADATGPGGSSGSLCSQATFDSGAGIAFNLGCSSVVFAVSGISYDQFSRPKSYNYDVSCADGSNRKVGSVSNITYNSLGQALTWDFTVNGTSCKKS